MKTEVYAIENLCCANCAARIEEKLNALTGVESAVLTFTLAQLRVQAEDPDGLLPEMERIARTVEPDVTIRRREAEKPEEKSACTCGHSYHGEESCTCGHSHHGEESCTCGHSHHEEEGCACGHGHHGEEGCACEHSHHGEESCSCGCGHHHDRHHRHHGHDHEHGADGKKEGLVLIAGAVLFLLGLVTGGHLRVGICLAAFLLLGWKILKAAALGLIRGRVLDENFLMAAASIGAFFIGNAPEGVGVLLFYRVGEFFEHLAVARSRSQIMEAVDLRPETVNLCDGEGVRVIPAAEARVGQELLVRPGDRIPLDGTVVSGESRIDTAPITGEPVPVSVHPGSAVISGCVNTQGQLTIRVEKVLEESMVSRILKSVESAAAGKPRIDRFISRFARVYTPVVVAAAAATAVVPSLITGDWNYWVYTALSFLVMSCPCALVLSVPLAFFAGIGAGGKKGILFKGGASMEAMGKIRAVVMDKTGTLTRGDFRVQQAEDMELLALCASCEAHSSHPIAVSITAAARERGLSLTAPASLEEFPGRGIQAELEGSTVLVGNALLLKERGIPVTEEQPDYGTLVYVAVDGRFRGSLLIADTVKEDGASAVEKLRKAGYATVMLTGDSTAAAEAVAKKLGVEQCYGSLLPEQKLACLQKIREEKGAAMFVGDGINDAPVLAGADVGAAMGTGADAAIEAADVVFMTGQAEAIPEALRIAKATATIAWQNVVFALGVKLIVMLLGLAGFASMWLAVFADSGVAMLCVLNSIRLLYRK